MTEEKNIRVLYVAGNGRSGSTLLDMILGQNTDCFSAGELTFIARQGLSTEYCSCRSTVGECEIWKKIQSAWDLSRNISIAEYRNLRRRFELNRSIPVLLINLVWPGNSFKAYCTATQSLFDAIHQVTQSQIIIDSSKSAARILVLKRFSELTVLHLCRNFTGVMNSLGKGAKKNVEIGIEDDLRSTPPFRALISWILNNLVVEVLSLGVRKHTIHYRRLVSGPGDELSQLGEEYTIPNGTPISAEHMLAGNRMRLRKNVIVDSNLGFAYGNLTTRQIRFGTMIDKLFWFWAK